MKFEFVRRDGSTVDAHEDEDGQAAAEYVIIVGMVVMASAAIFGVFPIALRDYHTEVVRILSLPIY